MGIRLSKPIELLIALKAICKAIFLLKLDNLVVII
jgi:hypothetical protein